MSAAIDVPTFSPMATRELDNQRFRRLLEERNLSHAAVAKKIGVSRRAVKSWATDRTPIPELLAKVCALLGVSADEILRPPRTSAPSSHAHAPNAP